MSKQVFKNVDELPLVLSVIQVASILGISRNTAYELVHTNDFPKVVIGKQYRVPKLKFIEWMEKSVNVA